jgi:hypothetical protein
MMLKTFSEVMRASDPATMKLSRSSGIVTWRRRHHPLTP